MSGDPTGQASPSDSRHGRAAPERALSVANLAMTLSALAVFGVSALSALTRQTNIWTDTDQMLVILLSLGFFSGSIAYQLARLGYIQRFHAARSCPPADLDSIFAGDHQPFAILVPAYREQPAVIRRTLLSAALQQYPGRRVVLLIDDPPAPPSPADAELLASARRLAGEVHALLAPGNERARAAVAAARLTSAAGHLVDAQRRLAKGHRDVAAWLEQLAQDWEIADHEEALFVERVLCRLARTNRRYALKLERQEPTRHILTAACNKLASQLDAQVDIFERKQYLNTDHTPNKAMNLNVYLSLLGRTVVEERVPDGVRLRLALPGEKGRTIPDASFVLTLDADSVLLPDYSIRLLHHLTAAGNERVAVAQTPYSAVPGSPVVIERIAGATTDIQFLLHQGFTRFGATFWVGANAVLRMAALRAIAAAVPSGDLPLVRFIQDRTVIEDTESSIDLRAAGWQLYNYPERLAYSSTPRDFGSLLIQRRRWANGGLLIVPGLLRQVAASREPLRAKVLEAFLRFHYLTSIAWVNLALILVFALPYRPVMPIVWLAAGSAPYFWSYARDLAKQGYRPADLLRVYALNLVLVPVNLGGVTKSLYQAVTGNKTPFARTPKVARRTLSPPFYVVAELSAVAYLASAAVFDLLGHNWLHGALDIVNLAFLSYGMARLVGGPDIWASLWPLARRTLTLRIRTPGKVAPVPTRSTPS